MKSILAEMSFITVDFAYYFKYKTCKFQFLVTDLELHVSSKDMENATDVCDNNNKAAMRIAVKNSDINAPSGKIRLFQRNSRQNFQKNTNK